MSSISEISIRVYILVLLFSVSFLLSAISFRLLLFFIASLLPSSSLLVCRNTVIIFHQYFHLIDLQSILKICIASFPLFLQ